MALSITDKIAGFIARPVETFRAARDETFGDAVVYFIALLIVNAVLSAIIGYLGLRAAGLFGAPSAGAGGVGAMVTVFIAAVVLGVIGLAVGSILLHIGVLVMGGRGGIIQTFKAVVYGLTPYYLLGWIPVVGLLAALWALIVEILGIRELHEMSTERAIVAWVISIVIIAIVLALLILVLGLAIFSIVGIASSSGGPGPVITMVSP